LYFSNEIFSDNDIVNKYLGYEQGFALIL